MPIPTKSTVDLSAIRRRAWAIMREDYHYPRTTIADTGWHCVRSAIKRAAHEIEHGTAAEQLERAAQAFAASHDFDTAALRFQRDRYQFGTLADTMRAPYERAIRRRALAIALERPRDVEAPVAITRVRARYLQKGDVIGSGETVLAVSAGVRTPAGKVEVTLAKDGQRRTSVWGASTTINVRRAEAVAR